MPSYIIAYHGGKMPESPEEGAKQKEKWEAWLGGLGDAVVNPGTPLSNNKIVSASGVSEAGPDALTGYSIVKADNMDAALEIAKACPYLEFGAVQVAEQMEMC